MKYQLEVVYKRTEDELKLQGMHYAPEKKKVGVVFVHGMSGNFIENDFADVMGKTLAQNGIGYIYGHNRGYGHINDIVRGAPKPTGDNELSRQGAQFERFSLSDKDVEAWVKQALEFGYKKIVVIGHSLGCAKLIYWWNRSKLTTKMTAVGLMSPADMVGLTVRQFSEKDFQALVDEAKTLMAKGKFTQILSTSFDNDWFRLSANTFMEEMVPQCPADVLPVYRPENKFEALAKVNVPMLIVYGDHNEVNINSVEEDLALLKKKAAGSPKITTSIIKGANHNYENREKELAITILEWIKSLE